MQSFSVVELSKLNDMCNSLDIIFKLFVVYEFENPGHENPGQRAIVSNVLIDDISRSIFANHWPAWFAHPRLPVGYFFYPVFEIRSPKY